MFYLKYWKLKSNLANVAAFYLSGFWEIYLSIFKRGLFADAASTEQGNGKASLDFLKRRQYRYSHKTDMGVSNKRFKKDDWMNPPSHWLLDFVSSGGCMFQISILASTQILQINFSVWGSCHVFWYFRETCKILSSYSLFWFGDFVKQDIIKILDSKSCMCKGNCEYQVWGFVPPAYPIPHICHFFYTCRIF